MKKLILLLLLLLSVVLLHRVSSHYEEPVIYHTESDLHIYAVSPPTYVRPEVKAVKVDSYYDLISRYDWDADSAYKIMMCESSGNPNANNFNHRTRDNSFGLFQINLYGNLANDRPSAEWLKVPENNIAYAYELYVKEGRRFGTTGGWFNCARARGVW